MIIKGKKILLRAIEEADLHLLQKWANDATIQSCLGGWHFPIAARDQRRWFEALSFNSLDQRFAIEVAGNGLIGTANLVQIDWQNRSAFHGALIGEPAMRGQGYALDAVMALMRFAFDEMDLFRLDSDIIECNVPSLSLYTQKAGWSREGVRPGWYFRRGRRWDKILIGITRQQYAEHCAAIAYWD